MKFVSLIITISFSVALSGQDKPYYYQIPDTPKVYNAATVAARLVDGLGFRYHWATEGLTEKDLAYKPSADARTSLQTIEHIKGLTDILFNAVNKNPTNFTNPAPKLSFKELRDATLKNIRLASEALKKPGVDLAELDMIFQRGENKSEFPFWNLINGPISDALWHVGQVVTFRRSSGNPLPAGVNVLTGTKTNQQSGD
jgi:hypothetical protein